MRIAAVLITKNEEDLLARCLDSIKGLDELIICDTGSEDSTVEIAKKYTDKVYTDYKWEDSFCKARNHANSKVSKDIDWIFTIDADEYLVNPVDDLYKEANNSKELAINIRVKSEKDGSVHMFPRFFRNDPRVYWIRDVHNILNISTRHNSKITTVYGYSPAHKKDPDRAMRILKKSLEKEPTLVREKYYLAREYFYRKMWQEAVGLLDKYVLESKFRAEIADAYLMGARCLWQLSKGEEARVSCMYAIMTNPDFKEALLFMAEMNYEPRKSKWLQYSQLAQNEEVLFVRTNTEKNSDYYNELFKRDSDMSRYESIYKKIQELVGNKSVLDIGCGLAELSNYIPNYSGFDFSEYAIEKNKDKDVWVGNAYESENYVKKNVYVCTEVLEHLDDLRVLKNIRRGQRLIFSVPSFTDPSHLRTYTEESIKELPVAIRGVYRFNWHGKWVLGDKPTNSYILLVDSNKA